MIEKSLEQLHIDQVDAYARRMGRMSVAIAYLHDQVVMNDSGAYPATVVAAIDLLDEELHECEAEQVAMLERESGCPGDDAQEKAAKA